MFGNPYLNFGLSVTVELIAIILSYFAFEKIGRKKPYVLCMFLSGLSLLAVLFVPKGNFKSLVIIYIDFF